MTEALCGTSFSKSTARRLVGSLDADLAAWRERRLEVAYPYQRSLPVRLPVRSTQTDLWRSERTEGLGLD